jgi:hypothetical protein
MPTVLFQAEKSGGTVHLGEIAAEASVVCRRNPLLGEIASPLPPSLIPVEGVINTISKAHVRNNLALNLTRAGN